MKGKGLLKNIKLDGPDTDPLKNAELRERQHQIWDDSVIDYIRIRGSNKDFREKIKLELSKNALIWFDYNYKNLISWDNYKWSEYSKSK